MVPNRSAECAPANDDWIDRNPLALYPVRFLTRYYTTRTLTPFAVYCLVVGGLAIIRFA